MSSTATVHWGCLQQLLVVVGAIAGWALAAWFVYERTDRGGELWALALVWIVAPAVGAYIGYRVTMALWARG